MHFVSCLKNDIFKLICRFLHTSTSVVCTFVDTKIHNDYSAQQNIIILQYTDCKQTGPGVNTIFTSDALDERHG